jgi:hypothetical protein
MNDDTSLTVIVLAVNETNSLKKVIEKILIFNFVEQIKIISPNFVSKDCLEIQKKLSKNNDKISCMIQPQNFPGIGGAVKYAATLVKTKYFCWVDGDGETDPYYLEEMFNIVKIDRTQDIVNASRFKNQKIIIKDYGFLSSILTYLFQFLCRIFFCWKITDFTVAYRIYKTDFFNKFTFISNDQNFALESILTPVISKDVKVKEIFYQWTKRVEGETQNSFINKLSYFKIFFFVFYKKIKI